MPVDIHDSETMGALYRRAAAVRAMIYRRAVKAYWRALGNETAPPASATLDMCVMHNSMIGYRNGQPWRGIDYSAMRLAIRLADCQHKPESIVRELFARHWRETYRRAA